MSDLVERGVGTRAVQHRTDNVVIRLRRLPQHVKPLLDQDIVALRAQPDQPVALFIFRVVGDLQDFDRMIVFGQEFVDPNNHLLGELDLPLVCGGRLRDLPLEPAALDAAHDAADGRDFGKQCFRFPLELVGEGFDVVRAAHRIDDLGNPGFVRQNLLRPERHLNGLLGG